MQQLKITSRSEEVKSGGTNSDSGGLKQDALLQ